MNSVTMYIKVKDLQEWENNVRIHTKRNLEALKQSLRAFKQTKPILVQKSTNRIIAGNGTYQAAVALGWEEMECRVFDVDDKTAKEMMISDNRTGELSEWDEKNLIDCLKEIQDDGELHLVGYDTLELEKMISYQDGNLYEQFSSKPADKKVVPDDFPQPAEPETPQSVEDSNSQSDTTKPSYVPPISSYEDQINFTINGFAFVLSDPAEIEEIRCLTEILKESSETDRKDVNRSVFYSIKEILTNKFMR